MKKLFAVSCLIFMMVGILSCDSGSNCQTNYNNTPSTQSDEYESCGGTYLYYDNNGELENLGEGDVYTKNGYVYIHLYDKIYPLYRNDNGNGHPSYFLFNGRTKVYTDVRF